MAPSQKQYATRICGQQADDPDLIRALLRECAVTDGWQVLDVGKIEIETIEDNWGVGESVQFARALLTVER